jgi:hypothetical protein
VWRRADCWGHLRRGDPANGWSRRPPELLRSDRERQHRRERPEVADELHRQGRLLEGERDALVGAVGPDERPQVVARHERVEHVGSDDRQAGHDDLERRKRAGIQAFGENIGDEGQAARLSADGA